MTFSFQPLLASCLLLVLALPAAGEGAAVQPESEERFQSEIRPILSRNCLACHGADSRQSGLVLESVADILRGGALSGPAVLVGRSSASPLIQYLKGEKEPRMPLTGSPLPEAEIAAISQWIDEMQVAAAGRSEEPSLSWPWTPLAEPPLPEVRNRSWVRNEVDAFILAKLEEEGMVPAPSASDRARLRRIYFGLIGLPPTPEEAEGFLGDPSSEAYRLEIERLLSPPRIRCPLGPALAGPGSLRRHRGRVDRRCPHPPVEIPGLRDPGFQPGSTLRSVHQGTDRRRRLPALRGRSQAGDRVSSINGFRCSGTEVRSGAGMS